MNVAIFTLEVLGLLAMLAVHRHNLKSLKAFFEDRLRAQDEAEEGRRVALYKQQKATAKTVAQSDRAVRKLADEARHLHDEIRLAQQRTDALARDVKEKL